jgi:mannose/fructose/N-acetylgalactosamine-specific phosphotransferase system component IIC
MVSRPLVAGVLAGWVIGDPMSGLWVGGLLELLLLSDLPVGGARFPEAGPAAVAAVATSAAAPWPGGLVLGVFTGLLVGEVGGRSVVALRHLNGRLAPDPTKEAISARRVAASHLAGIALDLLRGIIVTAVGILAGSAFARWAGGAWPLDMASSVALLLLGASVPMGNLAAGFGGLRRSREMLVTGVVVGLLGALLS